MLPELLELGMVPVVAAVVVAEVEEALVEVEADEVVEVVEFVLAETEVEVVMVVALDEVAELVAELLLVDEAEEELLEEPVPVREKATLQLVSSAVGPSATVKAYWPEGTSLGTVTVNEVPETPEARTEKLFMPLGGVPVLSSRVTGPLASVHFSSKDLPATTSKLLLVNLGLAEATVARAATMTEVNFILAREW